MTGRKKLKKNIIVCCDFDGNIYAEILSRLPVKSLVRFKSVSKGWQSLISSDNYFIDLHLSRTKARSSSSTLMVIVRTPEETTMDCVDLFNETVPVIRLIIKLRKHEYVLKPINGLICSYYDDYFRPTTASIRISNVMTKEETPWIEATIEKGSPPWPSNHYHTLTYGFGFDITTKEHKLICIWQTEATISQSDDDDDGEDNEVEAFYREDVVCKIMTVGRQNYSAWRMIDDFPPYTIRGDGIFVNGSLYWLSVPAIPTLHHTNNKSSPSAVYIVAFDLASEKFRSTKIPNFIMDQPDHYEGLEFQDRFVDILEVDGHIALLDEVNGQIVKLWIFEEDDDSHEKIVNNITVGCRDSNWIEETILMPFDPSGLKLYFFEPITGTNRFVIGIVTTMVSTGLYSLYLYNRENKTFTLVEISGMQRNIFSQGDRMATFTESLLPVPKQQQP